MTPRKGIVFSIARSKGLEAYSFSSPFGQIFPLGKSDSKAFRVPQNVSHTFCVDYKKSPIRTFLSARSKGLEPSAFRVTGGRSNQLSYDRK